jgi:vacuolar-type H+-ATPase subunit E/Vma4
MDTMRKIDSKVPLHAKLEPIAVDIASLLKTRRTDMLRQSTKALESALASVEAALAAEKQAAHRTVFNEAAKGQLAPRPSIKIVYED